MNQQTSSATVSSTGNSYMPVAHRSASKPTRHKLSTTDAYSKDIERLTRTFGLSVPCSADQLIAMVIAMSKRLAPLTVNRRCMALQDAHIRAGHLSPTADPRVREAMRWLGSGNQPYNILPRPKGAKAAQPPSQRIRKTNRTTKPIGRTMIDRMFDAMGTGTRTMDRRDKALILLGYAGLKRSAVCGLNKEDLAFTADAMIVHFQEIGTDIGSRTGNHQSTDSPAHKDGRCIAIPFTRGPLCAATAVQGWLRHNDWEGQSGPLFVRFTRSGEPTGDRLQAAYINQIIKDRLKACGVADVTAYNSESLRKGHFEESVPRRTRG